MNDREHASAVRMAYNRLQDAEKIKHEAEEALHTACQEAREAGLIVERQYGTLGPETPPIVSRRVEHD